MKCLDVADDIRKNCLFKNLPFLNHTFLKFLLLYFLFGETFDGEKVRPIMSVLHKENLSELAFSQLLQIDEITEIEFIFASVRFVRFHQFLFVFYFLEYLFCPFEGQVSNLSISIFLQIRAFEISDHPRFFIKYLAFSHVIDLSLKANDKSRILLRIDD